MDCRTVSQNPRTRGKSHHHHHCTFNYTVTITTANKEKGARTPERHRVVDWICSIQTMDFNKGRERGWTNRGWQVATAEGADNLLLTARRHETQMHFRRTLPHLCAVKAVAVVFKNRRLIIDSEYSLFARLLCAQVSSLTLGSICGIRHALICDFFF